MVPCAPHKSRSICGDLGIGEEVATIDEGHPGTRHKVERVDRALDSLGAVTFDDRKDPTVGPRCEAAEIGPIDVGYLHGVVVAWSKGDQSLLIRRDADDEGAISVHHAHRSPAVLVHSARERHARWRDDLRRGLVGRPAQHDAIAAKLWATFDPVEVATKASKVLDRELARRRLTRRHRRGRLGVTAGHRVRIGPLLCDVSHHRLSMITSCERS